MKQLFTLLIILTTPCVFGQFSEDRSGWLIYEEVVTADGMSKSDIHSKSNEWIAVNFNDANSVIKMNTENKIVVNGLSSFKRVANGVSITENLEYSLIVDFKEGRYKILVDNILSSYQGVKNPIAADVSNMSYEKWLEMYKAQMVNYDESIRKAAEKMLKNKKMMKETYKAGIKTQVAFTTKAKNEIQSIVDELKDFISNSSSNDDW